ncbi:hypothetical protein VP01_2593g3 [Puccinia sorghi]|uniref:Uncharacterized protein n=1 Tax=Puccinia sorghi TaxID=27349 RepID=A0A0L6V4R6_9BASI|nr:hypothetical protein VP01_2593g3 [Puccinia sorghi]
MEPKEEAISFGSFIESVTTACEGKFTNSGTLIRKSITTEVAETSNTNIKWSASKPQVDGVKISGNFIISSEEDLLLWIKTLANLGGVIAGLYLEIMDPKAE